MSRFQGLVLGALRPQTPGLAMAAQAISPVPYREAALQPAAHIKEARMTIRMMNCTVSDCGVGIVIQGEVDLHANGLDVNNCAEGVRIEGATKPEYTPNSGVANFIGEAFTKPVAEACFKTISQ